jgi:hypothetical protein
MQVRAPGPQLRFFLSSTELSQPLERGAGLEPVGVFIKIHRSGLSLGQQEGYLFCRLGEPCQMHPRGPQISAADYPATLLKTAPALFSPPRLYHLIESHSGDGNEKIRQKPLRVLSAESFCLITVANRDFDPYIFRALRIAITA